MKSLEIAKVVLKKEAESILGLIEQLGPLFQEATDVISNTKGKLIVTGVGKSGHIGRKLASTFSSLGTPSFFIHPSEGSHGDLGMIEAIDSVLAISYRGNSDELSHLIYYCQQKNIRLIAITGDANSRLGRAANVCLEAVVSGEADPLNLAPTSSTTAHMALGDALAVASSVQRGFKRENFAEFHPGGALGKMLLTKVKDIMHPVDSAPLVSPELPLLEVLLIMTNRDVRGIAGVVDGNRLVGIITDGDVRRLLKDNKFSEDLKARDVMSTSPVTIEENQLAQKALKKLQENKLQALYVVSADQKPVGAIRLHDLLAYGLS